MSKIKTIQTTASVEKFINSQTDEAVREDCFEIIEMMREVTKEDPYMWGLSIIGFGTYHYRYASGHEGDCPKLGFSPRKNQISLYLMFGNDRDPELMSQLGKYKTGKSCLYIKRLADIDKKVLRKIFVNSLVQLK